MRIDVIVPEGVSGPWRIEAFRVSEQESEMTLARAKITGTTRIQIISATLGHCTEEGVSC